MKFATQSISLAAIACLLSSANYAQQQPATPAAKPAAASAASAKAPQRLTVNGKLIPPARFEFFVKQRSAQAATGQAQGPSADSPEFMAAVKDDLINRELLTQEAERIGLDKNAEIAVQLDLARQQILAKAALDDFMKKNPVKEDALKTEYDRIKSGLGDKEYKVSHILVEKEDEAKDIIVQLKKGADFEKIAKEKSKDSGSKGDGGKLDWANKNMFPTPFSEAMGKLAKGQTTQEPVKNQIGTQVGFHVIKLDDVRALKPPSFDEVKENMRRGATQQSVVKLVGELRKGAKIEEK
jgi:peptidyl-prolyl cis-trans isomerase C